MEKTSSRRRFCIDNEAHCVGAHAICETLSQWEKLGWEKLAIFDQYLATFG